jgi:hypothetical protein
MRGVESEIAILRGTIEGCREASTSLPDTSRVSKGATASRKRVQTFNGSSLDCTTRTGVAKRSTSVCKQRASHS